MPAAYKNIARVIRPHGTKGEVLVAPLRGLPLLLEQGMNVCITPPALSRERFSRVEALSQTSDGARVAFSCSHDLDVAETLSGCYILAACEDIELGPLDASFEDLIGRRVVDDRHGGLGAIVEVMETPANDVWVVDGSSYGEVLIPVIDEVVAQIPSDGPIFVHVMDGLLNL